MASGTLQKDANQFVAGSNNVTDANAFLTGGVRMAPAATENIPLANVGMLVNFARMDGESTNWILQFYVGTYADRLYFRTCDNGNWKNWKEV